MKSFEATTYYNKVRILDAHAFVSSILECRILGGLWFPLHGRDATGCEALLANHTIDDWVWEMRYAPVSQDHTTSPCSGI